MKKKAKNKKVSINLAEKVVKSKPFYIAVLIIWCFYLYFNLKAPSAASNQFNISPQVINLLKISIALPYLLIWLSAVYSYIKIKRYAFAIKPSPEAQAFNNLANGIFLLLSSLILSTTFSTIRTYLADIAYWRPLLTILTNYFYVIPYLFAFIFLFKGADELSRQQPGIERPIKKYFLFSLPLALFMYFWLEMIFTNEHRVMAGPASKFATYYLKDSLLILTIVIPSLITWIISLLTVIKLKGYYQKVKGYIYKHALTSFIYGFSGVIIASIFLQALLSLGPQRLLDLGLKNLLGIIYLFLLIQAVGFFFIARGANRLIKIETV